ncbi:glyoxalase III HchA [Luteimonas aquatica]|uniref:glyoxalase III HchA n=1 Tax=Luteimonas aquatica TaxID=450364 RepID=UPI001F59569B|nr:glyoxalase III HchA [Luteimonas aquatica]
MNAREADMDKRPTPDPAEDNAFFPSPYSLGQYTSAQSDLDGADYPNAYRGGKWKVLMIATDERYLLMRDGSMFSTGNHPVEMLLPMYHLAKAGFDIDIATLSGNPVKLELWAFPREDVAVNEIYRRYLDKLKSPLKLADVIADGLGADSNFLAVFIPGGHGAIIGIPHSEDVRRVLQWAMEHDRHVVTLCHGPASLLATAADGNADDFLYKGYKLCVFPDALDRKNPDIGYMPGQMPWFVGQQLQALGAEILNSDITGQVHQDRKLITGDSPLASNHLGKAAAAALLAEAERLGEPAPAV